jgi:hypothetical protein
MSPLTGGELVPTATPLAHSVEHLAAALKKPKCFPFAHTGLLEALVEGDPPDLVRSANPHCWHARAHNEPRRSGSRADPVRPPSG